MISYAIVVHHILLRATDLVCSFRVLLVVTHANGFVYVLLVYLKM